MAQSGLPEVAVPADWEQKGLVIRVKDDLQHPQFSWPLTRLAYRLNFGAAGPAKDRLSLLDPAHLQH